MWATKFTCTFDFQLRNTLKKYDIFILSSELLIEFCLKPLNCQINITLKLLKCIRLKTIFRI